MLESFINALCVGCLPYPERRMAAHTWIKTFFSCSNRCDQELLLLIWSRFYIVVFQYLSDFAFLSQHYIAGNTSTRYELLWFKRVVLIGSDAMMLRLNRQVRLSQKLSCHGFVNWSFLYHWTWSNYFTARCNLLWARKTRLLLPWGIFYLNGFTTWRPCLFLGRRLHRKLSYVHPIVFLRFVVAWDELIRSLSCGSGMFTEGLSESAVTASATSLILVR
jgi:hypothetical protein